MCEVKNVFSYAKNIWSVHMFPDNIYEYSLTPTVILVDNINYDIVILIMQLWNDIILFSYTF